MDGSDFIYIVISMPVSQGAVTDGEYDNFDFSFGLISVVQHTHVDLVR